jgi:hypothetical protein
MSKTSGNDYDDHETNDKEIEDFFNNILRPRSTLDSLLPLSAVRKKIILTEIFEKELDDLVKSMLSIRPNSLKPFVSLVNRTISIDLFFNSLLCDEDLSTLLCTCRDMRELVVAWKKNIPIKKFILKGYMTDKMLQDFRTFYSSNIEELIVIQYEYYYSLTAHGFQNHFLSRLTRGSLKRLQISPFFLINGGLKIITYLFTNLTHLTLIFGKLNDLERNPSEAHKYYFPNLPVEDLTHISKLTNLEYLQFYRVENLQDTTVVNYSTLTKINSMKVMCAYCLSGLGLSYLVANKQFLVQLHISYCDRISSEGYHCLTTLTNLTKLVLYSRNLDDIWLNMICCNCVQIEYLDIHRIQREERDVDPVTITLEGYAHLHCLINLKSLFLYEMLSDVRLCNNTTLTSIHFNENCTILSDNGLLYNISSLVNLTKLRFDGCTTTISRERLSKLFHSLNNLIYLQIEAYCMNEIVEILYNPHFSFFERINPHCSTTNISYLGNLKHLVLTGTVSDETLFHLTSCSNLTKLEINNCLDDYIIISCEGLSYLSTLLNLTYLNISSCFQGPNKELCIYAISLKLVNLKYLYIDGKFYIYNDDEDKHNICFNYFN